MDPDIYSALLPYLKYIEHITLNFDGCLVHISKSKQPNKYSIDIDPGKIDFEFTDPRSGILYTELGSVAYVDLPYRIHPNKEDPDTYKEDAHIYEKYAKYDWFIYSKLSNGCKYFSNGDLFGIDDLNIIFINIKYGMDFLKFVEKSRVGTGESWADAKYWGEFLSGEYERDD